MNGSVGKAYRQPLCIILFHSKCDSLNRFPSTALAVICRHISPNRRNSSLLWHAGKSSETFQIHFFPKWTYRWDPLLCMPRLSVCILGYFDAMRLWCATRYAWHIDLFKCCFSPTVIFMYGRMCLWRRRMTYWIFYLKI